MLRVGLTGNIASGKSHTSQLFAEFGAHVIDADYVVHELLAPGTKTYRKIVDAFEEQILNADQTIDRRKLGRIIFHDQERRRLLNSLVHPDVGAEILQRIFDLEQLFSSGIVIVDAALMIETGSYKIYDRVIVVMCDPKLQISRLMGRDGLTMDEAKARINAQMPIEEKLRFADYTIDTSGTFKQTHDQAEAIYKDLLIEELRIRENSRIQNQ